MKLRIHGDSVRLRLTQAEVRRLAAGEALGQTTHFTAASQFLVSLKTSPDAVAMTASFDAGRMTVVIPAAQIRPWADSDQVGLQAVQPAGAGHTLQLLVEKDFRCLHSTPEDNPDAFPDPRR
jgi:hypothetical protein